MNCTDYAIKFAAEIGLTLPDPQGSFRDYFSGSNPNMFGNALADEEYMIYQEKIREDELKKLKKLLGK